MNMLMILSSDRSNQMTICTETEEKADGAMRRSETERGNTRWRRDPLRKLRPSLENQQLTGTVAAVQSDCDQTAGVSVHMHTSGPRKHAGWEISGWCVLIGCLTLGGFPLAAVNSVFSMQPDSSRSVQAIC